jgi:hypothetical protein
MNCEQLKGVSICVLNHQKNSENYAKLKHQSFDQCCGMVVKTE